MSSLRLKGVKKSYGNTEVLHGIDFEISAGQFVVVVGPSGCGKSSLLRMVAGLENVSDGEIYIADKLVNKLEAKDRDIAMVFQNYALYPHMTVFKNMAYGLKMRKFAKALILQRVRDAAQILKIEHLLERKPQDLSGGQRQRVAMGRAIVRQPEVFLFDEPLSNLDTKLRTEMRLEIKKLQKRLNTTSLYVTHDQTEAMTMADKIIVLNQGIIEQFASPHEIFYRPHSKFVADFMGNHGMNFIEAQVEGTALHLGTASVLTDCLPREIADSKVELGLRSEDIYISDQDGLQLEVDMVENLGGSLLIHGFLVGTDSKLIIKSDDGQKVSEKERLPISFNREKMQLFSLQSGKNLTLGIKHG